MPSLASQLAYRLKSNPKPIVKQAGFTPLSSALKEEFTKVAINQGCDFSEAYSMFADLEKSAHNNWFDKQHK